MENVLYILQRGYAEWITIIIISEIDNNY